MPAAILPKTAATRLEWGSDVVDVSIVPEAAWRNAQRRAELIRPLLENDDRHP
jgi:hypothetical protein